MVRISGESGLPERPSRDASDYSYFDSDNQTLLDGAMQSKNLLLVEHIHNILLSRFFDDTAEEIAPMLKAIERHAHYLKEEEVRRIMSHTAMRESNELDALTPLHTRAWQEPLPPVDMHPINSELKRLSFIFYHDAAE
jgi:hypothetical protein